MQSHVFWDTVQISRKALRRGVSHTDFDIDEIINSADRKLFSQITQPRHCLRHLLPPKTSTHFPYSPRKRQYNFQLSHVEYSQYVGTRCRYHEFYLQTEQKLTKTVSSLVVYLTFDDFRYDCNDDYVKKTFQFITVCKRDMNHHKPTTAKITLGLNLGLFLQPANLITYTIFSLFSLQVELAPHLLSPQLDHTHTRRK